MEHAVWNAARRLAVAVLVALAAVVLAFERAARVRALPAVAAIAAVLLFMVALVPLARAHVLLHRGLPSVALPPASVYRSSARPVDDAPDPSRAIRASAAALMLLAVAGALAVVGAAAW